MELNFQKAGHDYYEPLRFTPFTCETMRENIVPDSCGDIARIVDTTGAPLLPRFPRSTRFVTTRSPRSRLLRRPVHWIRTSLSRALMC